MLPENVRTFCAGTQWGVLTTFRRNGAAQMSVVACGPLQDGVAFLGTLDRAKVRNLKRNPRCSLLVSREDWRDYVVLEGRARIVSSENTDPEEWRLALQDTQRAYSGREHPNWEQFDQTMIRERRVSVIIVPDHIYGTAI